jgi:MFS family permease
VPFLFGHFGDRTGRKFSFMVNIIIVGATTCLTGLLSGYEKLGIAAPVLLVVLRIVQGIGLGGEFGGTSSLLGEFAAQRSRRALWISLANLVGVPLGAMSASVVMLVMSKTFTTSGWRVAMLLSVVIVIPAQRARYKLADSPLFEQLRQSVKRLQTIHGTFHCEERSRGSMILALSVPLSGTTGKLGPRSNAAPTLSPLQRTGLCRVHQY